MSESLALSHQAYIHGPKPESPEGVALALLEMIYAGELVKPSREEILSTYAECLRTVRSAGPQDRPRKRTAAPMEDELRASRPTSSEQRASVERFDKESV